MDPEIITSTASVPTNSENNSLNQSLQVPLTCSGHTRPVVQLQFSPIIDDKTYLISACKDGNPILRNGTTGDWIGTFLGHKGAVWSAKLDKTASKAVTGSADFSAKLWDAFTGEIQHSFPHKHIVKSVEFDEEDSRIITAGHEKVIRIFDINAPEKDPITFPALSTNIKTVIWKSESNLIYSSGEDKFLRIWDDRTNQEVKEIEVDYNITNMSLSFDGSILMCAAGKQVKFWDSKSFDLIKSFGFSFDASSVSLLPKTHSKFVVGGVSDLWVRTYDFSSGNELEVYKGHHGPIHSVSYSPDGEIYATGSEDGTIRLWQTTPGKPYGLWQPRKVEELPTSDQVETTVA